MLALGKRMCQNNGVNTGTIKEAENILAMHFHTIITLNLSGLDTGIALKHSSPFVRQRFNQNYLRKYVVCWSMNIYCMYCLGNVKLYLIKQTQAISRLPICALEYLKTHLIWKLIIRLMVPFHWISFWSIPYARDKTSVLWRKCF